MSTFTFSQATSPIQLKTTLGENELLPVDFVGRESLSEPFEFRLQMFSQDGAIDASKVLRNPATVSIQIPNTSELRYFNAIFRDFAQSSYNEVSRLYTYEATLVPSLWFLSLGWNCKIFQNLTVPQIVEEVLQANGVKEYKLSLQGTYPEREYCVQYRESNLNFISRLLEEEGITYYFEHADGKHTLMIVDRTSSAPECKENQVSYSATEPSGTVASSTVWSLLRTDQVYSPKVALTDYYFETPSINLLATAQTVAKTAGPEEKFDYPGGYRTNDDGTRYGNLRIEELETFASMFRGNSNCSSFGSGFQFTLADHYRDETNQAYLLTVVYHHASMPNALGAEDAGFSYENRFEAIPLSVNLRPPRITPKPLISGSQTAVVVGPMGEEIYVDKYGRVKVQFFWDRDGKKDENSSCWVRVSQIWAGKMWGWITIPRVGQEVVVDFLEGDPDRPLIVGRIYNAEQMPPYTLPDNSTQSGIRSRSSKGGGSSNFNEICIEDKQGNELITVHAEKDMLTEVENNDTITVQQGNHSLTLQRGNQTTKIQMGSESHEAMQQIELKVGESSIVLTQQGITIKALTISIQGTMQLEAKAAMTTVNADGVLTLKGALTMIN